MNDLYSDKLFALLDAARIGDEFEELIGMNNSGKSLYAGENAKALRSVAPHLFKVDSSSDFKKTVNDKGWGNAWGVFLVSSKDMDIVYKHFRKFLKVKTEDGMELYFRFYDPRILKIFLPTCNENQIIEFFGPVEKFFVEGDVSDEAIEFSQKNGTLVQKKIAANLLINENATKAVVS